MNQQTENPIFIGAAWPYANSSLHLGHIAALLPADILARFYRLKGNPVLFVSGSDCHGTPITIEAEKQKIKPKEIAEKFHQQFKKNLCKELNFSYDLYTKTDSKFHQQEVQKIFLKLYKKKLIYKKAVELPYCECCKKFLPDRFIEGKCPICQSKDARGDQCDHCGSLLDPKELQDSRCKLCEAGPVWKKSTHFFLKLSHFKPALRKWIIAQKYWKKNAKEFTLNLLAKELKDRAITRDIEWGVKIPFKGYQDKRIYVWFEAVCGYLTASKKWAKIHNQSWKKFWQNKNAYHFYVHGKDNIIFHTIVWPSILMVLEKLHLPDQIVSSEYLNLEGKQFSKSRQWAVWLPDFLKKYPADSLRYYLTINAPESHDANFIWQDFFEKNNKELVGTLGNFIQRSLSLIKNNFNSQVPDYKDLSFADRTLLQNTKKIFQKIENLLQKNQFKKALREIFILSKEANQYIDFQAPWKKIKQGKLKEAKNCLYVCAQISANLAILISPFFPQATKKLEKIFNLKNQAWQFIELKSGSKINKLKPLFKKLEKI